MHTGTATIYASVPVQPYWLWITRPSNSNERIIRSIHVTFLFFILDSNTLIFNLLSPISSNTKKKLRFDLFFLISHCFSFHPYSGNHLFFLHFVQFFHTPQTIYTLLFLLHRPCFLHTKLYSQHYHYFIYLPLYTKFACLTLNTFFITLHEKRSLPHLRLFAHLFYEVWYLMKQLLR